MSISPDAAGPAQDLADEPESITGDETADAVLGQLLREPDAVARHRTARALQDRMPWVAALSASQLIAELGSAEKAGEALGVTRQQVDGMIRQQQVPSKRRGRPDPAGSPAYQYGRLIAVCEWAGRAVDKRLNRRAYAGEDVVGKLYQFHLAQPGVVIARLHDEVARWTRRLHGSGTPGTRDMAENLTGLVTEALDRIPPDLPPRLGMEGQAQATLGYHHEMVRLRDVRPRS